LSASRQFILPLSVIHRDPVNEVMPVNHVNRVMDVMTANAAKSATPTVK
jgi:hypothetical protein